MAKRIKFALEMKDGAQVRNLEDLKENFDLEKAIGYFLDGKLITWLNERYYYEEAQALKKLSKDDKWLNKKLCQILGVKYQDEKLNLEEIKRRNERIAKLKQYTDDQEIIDNVDLVAFNQKELDNLLDDDKPVIYLCKNKFIIPFHKNKKYINIGKVEIAINYDYYSATDEDIATNANMYISMANKGDISIMNLLGYMYDYGIGVEKNKNMAFSWYQKAAKAGNPIAMCNLADMYDTGDCVLKNEEKAIDWYNKAFSTNDPDAIDIINNL